MIKRLRPKYTEEELQAVYDHQYDHTNWKDHIERVKITIAIGRSLEGLESVADLSAGDGAIINGLDIPNKIIGDYVPGFEYVGKIEDTIQQIPKVDLFISSETLEHVDDPLKMLKDIRNKTNYLLLSTPEDNFDDSNPEHYWSWDKEGVQELLQKAGFKKVFYTNITLAYKHQIWICK